MKTKIVSLLYHFKWLIMDVVSDASKYSDEWNKESAWIHNEDVSTFDHNSQNVKGAQDILIGSVNKLCIIDLW